MMGVLFESSRKDPMLGDSHLRYRAQEAPHPYDHETASLRIRGDRRRALNYEDGREPHFLRSVSLDGPESKIR